MKYHDAIFVITEERSCPLYNVGEEFVVRNGVMSISSDKPSCLLLVREIIFAISDVSLFERFSHEVGRQAKFECGGCIGVIRFELKREREFSTLQMKLLAASEQSAEQHSIAEFYDLLRNMEIFESLANKDVRDLSTMLKLKTFAAGEIIISKGDPGSHLYIILSGTVAVVRDGDDVLAEVGAGQIFGEMSLLSGEPIMTSVYAKTDVRLAVLSAKDFKHVLSKFPILHVFFYRMLIDRLQSNSSHTDTITSGMGGNLAEVNPVELFQLINSSGKTGRLEFLFSGGRATVLFYEGEIVSAVYGELEEKEALFALLAKNKGLFSYSSGLSDEEKDLPVLGGFMSLIMEGLQRIDEEE